MDARARTSRALTAARVAAVAIVAGCSAPEPTTTSVDLLSLLPFTDTRQATETIDFASPLGEAHLVSGWSAEPPEEATAVPGVRYLRQPAGRMFFHLAEPAERTLTIRCAGVNLPKRTLPATFHLNGVYVGQGAFPTAMETVSLRLRPRAQRLGRNELAIVARIPRRPPPEIARRHGLRAVALACERLTLDGPAPADTLPRLVAEGANPLLLLPPAATAQLYLRAQADAVIGLGSERSDSGAALRVVREDRAGDADVLYEGSPGPAALRIPLGGEPGEIVRLQVAAGAGGAVRLDRLTIDTPRDGTGAGRTPAPPAWPTNVILYVIDTLRADHVGAYGYPRDTTPRLDALAREAVLFEDAQAQASWTRPAVASLLTGVTPLRHGAVRLRSALGDDVPTVAELLRARGWATAAWVTNMNVSPHWGFGRGFDRYEYLEEDTREGRVYVPAPTIHEAALGWIRERSGQPFFLYLHASDTHGPYTPGEPWRQRFEGSRPDGAEVTAPGVQAVMHKGRRASAGEVAWLRSLYDGEIAELDAAIGAFVDQLRALDVLDRTLLVVVADHGEEFHDHGAFSHGRTLHRELLQVPLLVRLPNGAHGGTRVRALVQHVDVFATILDQLGVPTPEGVDGRSMLPHLAAAGASDPHAIAVSHTWLGQAELVATTAPDWKVIVRRRGTRRGRPADGTRTIEVYDRTQDRDERANVADGQALLAAWAQQEVAAHARQASAPVDRTVSRETEEKLRALGYVAE
jgi:arylsulfatase